MASSMRPGRQEDEFALCVRMPRFVNIFNSGSRRSLSRPRILRSLMGQMETPSLALCEFHQSYF